MCLTCGCNDAHKRMGSNLTYEDLRVMAAENGQTVDEALRTIRTEHFRAEYRRLARESARLNPASAS